MDGDGGIDGVDVEVEGLTLRYGELTAVAGVDLRVAAGAVVGIIGPNGAGKTSLMECAAGLRRPTAGRVRIAGRDPLVERDRITALAGVQLQHTSYPPRVTVGEVCRLFAGFYRNPADYRALLDEFGLQAQRSQRVDKLSGGQQQRLSLVLALLGRPRVVFLDELTTGLDPVARRAVWEGLRARNDAGLTVLITSHHMEEVEYLCDRVAVMVAGKLAADDTVSALIEAYAGSAERFVVESAGQDRGLRRDLEQVGDGVRVTPSGNRLRIDITEPALGVRVRELLRQRQAVSRPLGASLEEVYLTLTGQQATEDGENVR